MDFTPRAAHHFGVRKHFQMPGVALAIVHAHNSEENVGWHYHENPHLTFILRGKVIEGTRKTIYQCAPGKLLFHGSFEPHYNTNLETDVRCLHIDFDANYSEGLGRNQSRLHGIFDVTNPAIKLLCYKAFREAVLADDLSEPAIHALALDILGQLFFAEHSDPARPLWVDKLEEILRGRYAETVSLSELSRELNVHPVHISRSFARYFHCTLGEYLRNLRVERSLRSMSCRTLSLTEIATACGFADQSHFTRSFKQKMGVSPSIYRRSFFC
jgi:AraC-like DNA-binding protein